MSQVHYEYMSLETLAERSPCIVVARRGNPPVSIEKIYPDVLSQDGQKKDIPPYQKRIYSFMITKILKDRKKRMTKGPLQVLEPHFESSLKVHMDFYQKGLMRSPCYEAYNPGKDTDELDEVILFLNYTENENVPCRFACDFSWESTERMHVVRSIIRKQKKGVMSFLKLGRR